MKKRLLFAFMAMCAAVSGFALEQGDFVYTPQGRFQITGANLNANNAFQDMSGWTAIGEGKTLADLFITNADGLAAGMNSVTSTAATAGEGMYFKFEPTDASAAYVVSFKMKGAALDNIRIRIPGDGYKTEANLVKVAGNDANVYTHPATEGEVIVNTAEELNENWQTFNFAIQGDGTARTWFISFTAMATTIEIADLQIAPAMQFADLRQRDAMLEKLNIFKSCYEWPAEVLEEYAITEAIENLNAIGDETGQAELDEQIVTAQEILDEFINANMDDYLPTVEVTATTNGSGSPKVDVKFKQWFAKVQKAITWGDWNCLPSGRGFWEQEAQGAADFGHYAGNTAWNYGNTGDPMGVYMQKALDPGSYVFGIESSAALREDPTSSSWTNNDGWNIAYGVAYIVKMENEVATDTIASVVKDLDAVNFTTFSVPVTIQEAGTYEIGYKAYCKDAYKDLKNGSVVYVKNASIWGKNNNKYNQKQLGYEADVREQITAGRDNLTTAAEYLDNADYFWGKNALKACVDSIAPRIEAYEALDQDAIIATYQDDYAKSTSEETGYMVYEVYQQATKWIIVANKEFVAENDTLASIQTAINNAVAVGKMRLYDAATGKAELQSAIDAAKALQAQMKASEYSEENAAAIVAAIELLNEAVEAYKASVPASAIATIVDIDFEQDAVLNEESGLYSVNGAAGSMEFSNWSTDGTGESGVPPFEKGYWANGEQLWKGYIRIGNGTGTAIFDATQNGSMGTNILKVACDMYIQGLSGRSLGFFLKNEVEGENGLEDATIFGIYHNFYNWTTETNTCDVNVDMFWAKAGGSYNNASPADATDSITANPLQKSHVEVIMDYGTKKMYCTINSINGSTTSNEVDLEAVPTKFILQCNYNNYDRRAWFDNLLIQRITAGEPAGIQTVQTETKANVVYNINGMRVAAPDQKGVYIVNGRKVVIR